MSRTILGFTLVICCALALMPLLVRPTPVGREVMEQAVADATLRVKDLQAAQVPAASYIALPPSASAYAALTVQSPLFASAGPPQG